MLCSLTQTKHTNLLYNWAVNIQRNRAFVLEMNGATNFVDKCIIKSP